jgi:hypothetical protein
MTMGLGTWIGWPRIAAFGVPWLMGCPGDEQCGTVASETVSNSADRAASYRGHSTYAGFRSDDEYGQQPTTPKINSTWFMITIASAHIETRRCERGCSRKENGPDQGATRPTFRPSSSSSSCGASFSSCDASSFYGACCDAFPYRPCASSAYLARLVASAAIAIENFFMNSPWSLIRIA